MGFSWFLLHFVLHISFYLIIISSANGNSNLIQETCKKTKYYDLCVSLLGSDTSSPKSDTKELALIVIRYGIANATDTNSYLSKQIQSVANDTVMMKTAMRECADKYASANGALQNSLEVMSVNMYDYAYLHVMAAGDYPNGCRNAFNRWPGMCYPSELAVREDGLKRICDVVLGIIDSLD
ncbi:cell wall / vacuolar inhibitor of fructosidase 2-like [Primulina huaijiensis]|uniref:cell wall / vacuolar inhibitor of fructosidase 2-like n=1 Tax=Primulina huaijiensis TaxID=1492673 RepID=UPI003CC74E67